MFNARRQGYPGISYTTLKAETERDICFERRSKQVKNERITTKDKCLILSPGTLEISLFHIMSSFIETSMVLTTFSTNHLHHYG